MEIRRLKQLTMKLGAASSLMTRPSWALEHLRDRVARGRAKQFSLTRYGNLLVSEAEAVSAICAVNLGTAEQALISASLPEAQTGDSTAWASRAVLLRLLSAITELTKPTTALEIGVERGHSSVVLLRSLAQRNGSLHSIDLPRLDSSQGSIGQLIPSELRQNWRLYLGPSRTQLPRVLGDLDRVDLFLHDGAHSYRSQLEDLRRVWPHLPIGAVAVIDDVWSPAIIDFASSVGHEPLIVRRFGDGDGVGLLRRRDEDLHAG